jgi:predicted Fe-Mo cluster-binding NifX family protein
MKIAVPTVDGQLARHFGHCRTFTIFNVDTETGSIEDSQATEPPPHEPGVLPRWLNQKGVEVVLAGGMGRRAQSLFQDNGIEVVVGASPDQPEAIVKDYLTGALATGENPCAH